MPSTRNDPRGWEPITLWTNVNESQEAQKGRLRPPWQYIFCNSATYSPEIFSQVALQLIHHPERNSKNIRRADILADIEIDGNQLHDVPNTQEGVERMVCCRTISRRLMPRNPNLDSELEQTCRFYIADRESAPTLVTYYCHFNGEVPYYTPDVQGVGFELFEGRILLAYLPLPWRDCKEDKLLRVALNLLKTMHRHCLGTQEGYKKRVHHDLLVDKAVYQDLYITLKKKYAKFLIDNWSEATDPLKHVFEDISLATFLILLWSQSRGQDMKFVDIGCGNGLLVYLLTMEGYQGYGIDARRRNSWNIFPKQVQSRLYEKILIPHFLEDGLGENVHDGMFEDNTFLISNHSDELTPWTPLLAALVPGSAFLAIPCCERDFSGAKIGGGFLKTSNESGAQGRYAMYCQWICDIAQEIGWLVEMEMLRIPSTRNRGIVGRQIDSPRTKEKALEVISRLGGSNGYQGFIDRAKGLKAKVHSSH